MGLGWQTGYMENLKSLNLVVDSPDIAFPNLQIVALSHIDLRYLPPIKLCLDSLQGSFARLLTVQPENHKSWSYNISLCSVISSWLLILHTSILCTS